ncbi:pyridoxal-phosphate dependent enzyme [Sphingomonas panacisoli]|nr:pyridoxal-phosphate dependent enzyme [Sphingomonas panacisoli]
MLPRYTAGMLRADVHPGFHPDLADVRAVLTAVPGYRPTSLRRQVIDGRGVMIKDERARFGLGSFKPLGGLYAVTRLARSGARIVCASAGNHGIGVAAGAARIGAHACIYLPAGTPVSFAERIADLGGEVRWSSGDYDVACTEARWAAETTGAIWLPDGDPSPDAAAPSMVMAGYQLLAEEISDACERTATWPAHVFLQAGVGGLAAAIAHHVRAHWPVQPRITVVEAAATPCLAASNAAGRPMTVTGPPSTMQRLDCPVPSHIA